MTMFDVYVNGKFFDSLCYGVRVSIERVIADVRKQTDGEIFVDMVRT
jgi:hypothetical protein